MTTNIPFRTSLAQCSSFDEIATRFQNAPSWILEKWEKGLPTWGNEISPAWEKDGSLRYLPPLVPALKRRWAAEKATSQWFIEHPEYVGVISSKIIRQAFERGKVWNTNLADIRLGNGPTTEEWSYSDDHPSDHGYTDEAWTKSKEVSPGVWFEAKHHCMGSTYYWAIIAPPEVIRERKDFTPALPKGTGE